MPANDDDEPSHLSAAISVCHTNHKLSKVVRIHLIRSIGDDGVFGVGPTMMMRHLVDCKTDKAKVINWGEAWLEQKRLSTEENNCIITRCCKHYSSGPEEPLELHIWVTNGDNKSLQVHLDRQIQLLKSLNLTIWFIPKKISMKKIIIFCLLTPWPASILGKLSILRRKRGACNQQRWWWPWWWQWWRCLAGTLERGNFAICNFAK